MVLEEYVEKGGHRLRLGYTTGSCAAAAAKAAAMMLLTGQMVPHVRLRTPKGTELVLEIEEIRFFPEERAVSCAVRKDSGDDPDITNRILVHARVALSPVPGIRIDGGEGVGRVTRPGLDQPVGDAAINSTPRKMIEAAVREAARACGDGRDSSGFDVLIYVPRGRELAAKTFNPKLGIEGGISILGTSGIVEPMSDRALLDTIRVEIRVRKQEGFAILPAAPGNYGKNFFLEKYGFSLDTAVTASNFIYDTVQMAQEAGFTRMLFVGHIGKLVKVAGGIRNTHSRYGDHRMEILTEIAESIVAGRKSTVTRQSSVSRASAANPAAGRRTVQEENPEGDIFPSLRRELAACVTTDDAVRILRERKLDQPVLAEMTRRIQTVMQDWTQGCMQVGVIVFSNVYGELGRTENALEYMRILRGGQQ